MDKGAGLRLALDLLAAPSRIKHARSCELPDGVELVLRIAGQEKCAIDEAAKFCDHPQDFVERAAVFFIEQVLLTPGTDSYRVLGARRDASHAELRRNFLLLVKCLHPDQLRGGERSTLVSKVIEFGMSSRRLSGEPPTILNIARSHTWFKARVRVRERQNGSGTRHRQRLIRTFHRGDFRFFPCYLVAQGAATLSRDRK